ncbi:MAG: tetratricopeptide repeat protein [Bacteroidales bacterium]|nr:tetratricopeptide repeat protein [Bacteroidales bacterium]
MEKKNLWTSIVLILVFLSTAVMGQNPRKFYKAGEEFIETANFEDAIEQFSKAIELDPDFVNAYIARANAYENVGKFEEATEDYNRALVFKPKEADVSYRLGVTYNKLNKYEEALLALNKATKLSKRNLPPYQEKVKTLLALEDYKFAIKVADTALLLKENALNFYQHGLVNEKLGKPDDAEKDYMKAIAKDRRYIDGYLSLAELRIELNKLDQAMNNCNTVINLDSRNTRAYLIRSEIYTKSLDYVRAINDISHIILIEPENSRMYYIRGTYYQEFNQHGNAINDFNKVISVNDKDPDAYFKRAKSYEEIMNYEAAAKDYETITTLSEFDMKARKLLEEAKDRLFEINRESDKPIIVLRDVIIIDESTIQVQGDKDEIVLKGVIEDQSDLEFLKINEKDVHFEGDKSNFEFLTNVKIKDLDQIIISAGDVYENQETAVFTIMRTETNAPIIRIIAPYASDNGEIYLDSNDPSLYVEGKIADESQIKSIQIQGMNASYQMEESNPAFSGTINILNMNKFTVVAEDVYGNIATQEFTLNREGAILAQTNPMGKTWVVFIENSNYESFASLDGPVKDISLMKGALAKYQIHNIIHKKDMTKEDMEKFFSIELRDLVRSNRVNSLMIWYAGHGKFVNEVGYWIPIDAQRDDEFSYFNINGLKAGMQGYSAWVTHTLVVTDACESGPTFYTAMRSIPKERSCDDWQATKLKSSQVFSSAGYELAVDNSQFTRTFASALANNPNACIPIENIVTTVTIAVAKNNQQKPKFGKIAGLEDENGTFFFMIK